MGNLMINRAALYRRFRSKTKVAFRHFVEMFSLLAHTGHARKWYHVSSQRISWMARSGSGTSPTTMSHIVLLKNWMGYPFVSLPFTNGNFTALRLAVLNTCVPWGPRRDHKDKTDSFWVNQNMHHHRQHHQHHYHRQNHHLDTSTYT